MIKTSSWVLIYSQSRISVVRTYLPCLGCANTDYTKLFGEYSPDRYYRVVENYANIQTKFIDETFGANCQECRTEMSVYAYVYPTDPNHIIYLCGAYWAASVNLQKDSKPVCFVIGSNFLLFLHR